MDQNEDKYLNVISKGNLDEITKPSSGTSRSGSRLPHSTQSSGSSVQSRHRTLMKMHSEASSTLEILSPEQLALQNFDLEVEEYESGRSSVASEAVSQKTGRSSQMFGHLEPQNTFPQAGESENLQGLDQSEEDRLMIAKLEAGAESDVDSEEERDILLEIRAEITNQVKSEMKDELAVYQYKKEKLGQEEGENKDDLEDLDPKLKEAILKMRKLDRILARKVKKEKEVKRQRLLLQKKLREELANIKPEGRELKEVKVNTEKFLALAPPPSHNEGVLLEDDDISPPVTPVFQTQVPDPSKDGQGGDTEAPASDDLEETCDTPMSVSRCQSHTGTTAGTDSQADGASSTCGSQSETDTKKRRKKGKDKDFIQRNVQLAADAANVVAMTDDEKARLKDLLEGIDEENFIDYDLISDDGSSQQLSIALGDGYLPDSDEMKRLNYIDDRLRHLLPRDDWESIATPRSMSSGQSSMLFTRTNMFSTEQVQDPGEDALKEVRDDRDVQGRLEDIENQLASMRLNEPLPIPETPVLSKVQLNDLLNQCARTMSRASTIQADSMPETPHSQTSETTIATSASSSLTDLYSNPPHIARDTLDQLLASARHELAIEAPPEEPPAEPQPGQTYHSIRQDKGRGSLVLESVTEQNEDVASSTASSRCSSASFLPPIDPKGSLSTQKQNGFPEHFDLLGSRSPAVQKDFSGSRSPMPPSHPPSAKLVRDSSRLSGRDSADSTSHDIGPVLVQSRQSSRSGPSTKRIISSLID